MPRVATNIRIVWAVNQWGEENIISESELLLTEKEAKELFSLMKKILKESYVPPTYNISKYYSNN